MSSELLERLKVKQTPLVRRRVGVIVQKKPVDVKTKLVDKTRLHLVDRGVFMRNIKQKTGVTRAVKPEARKTRDRQPTLDDRLPKTTLLRPAPLELTIEIIGKRKQKISLVPAKQSVDTEKQTALISPKPPRRTASPIGVVHEAPLATLAIEDTLLKDRLGEKIPEIRIRRPTYYMNNRKIFVNFITSIFLPYKKEIDANAGKASCERGGSDSFSLMAHQRIIRDYINLYTPYRGLLLFHGLGSGKTCSSIAIAEGIKTDKPVIVMTPASLKTNYMEELKKCGDTIYKKNQFWEFIDTQRNPDLIHPLSNVLSLSVEFIRKQGGAWLVNVKKKANFSILSGAQKQSVDRQIDEMIRHKYRFISYNGLRMSHLQTLTANYKKNPFDNSVVVIDEAHNFVSRIVNKLKKPDSLSMKMYEYLMTAENVKIVFLTGTPIINYPNELSIMFNILRGKIKTWSFALDVGTKGKINLEFFKAIFSSKTAGGSLIDYMEYKPSTTTLVITRNPYGFVNKTQHKIYDGVRLGERGELDDDQFVKLVTQLLKKNKITVNPSGIKVDTFKALPDSLDSFKAYFIDDKNNVKNMNLLKRRILGLTSYFRSAQESLMPRYVKGRNFRVIKVPMSDFQFGVYEEARVQERELERRNAKKRKKQKDNLYEDTVSTYRIFSRAFCNFVFPRPDIKRPMPIEGEDIQSAILNESAAEDIVDIQTTQEKINDVDGKLERDEIDAQDAEREIDTRSYQERIAAALELLNENSSRYLTPKGLETYSPKFLHILENIQDPAHVGLHLIYSQFRTLEGIGILKLVLEANGFAQFKIKPVGQNWILDIKEEDLAKPKFVLYTGTETTEEKEVMRNIFNGLWEFVPTSLVESLRAISPNNMMGEIIKIFMITASGAEGISLKNVRYVHITEPYWHPVRVQQVIGRARRICSHQDLPEELRTVDVFLYLMTFTDEQLSDDRSVELRLKDKGRKIDTPLTSDEALFEISTIKEEVSEQLLDAVKESSIDCSLHSTENEKDSLTCFTFGTTDPSSYSYYPSIEGEDQDTMAERNKIAVKVKLNVVRIKGIKYAFNKETNEVFDWDSYKLGQLVPAGRLEIMGKQFKFIEV